jgi:hypothetical protein
MNGTGEATGITKHKENMSRADAGDIRRGNARRPPKAGVPSEPFATGTQSVGSSAALSGSSESLCGVLFCRQALRRGLEM